MVLYMARVNLVVPDELWERVGRAAPAGNKSFFVRNALEAALGRSGGVVPAPTGEPVPASPRASFEIADTPRVVHHGPQGKVKPPLPEVLDGANRVKDERLKNMREQVAAVEGKPARECDWCAREFLSPTLKRCQCGGKIVPPPVQS
jgi:hypothetical protein